MAQTVDDPILASRNPPIVPAQGFEPLSVAGSLPPCFHGVFSFRYFNSIQADCFHCLYHSRDSCVVASPTGSGKTSLFELAILGMLREGLATDDLTDAFEMDRRTRGLRKAIYVAPMKSLVQEKAQEWKARFGSTLGLTVNEFTGEHWSNGVDEIECSDIILTTPERFDSITRRAGSCKNSNTSFLSQVQLVMLDEVHLLAENRGPSLEAVVSRLKLSRPLAAPPRFMACSATFRNIEDVAQWLSVPPWAIFSFGNEMRPVPLEIKIKTYPSKSNNEFLFSKKLDDHVYPVLNEFSNNKPALCFCTTKSETSRLAKKLSSEYRTPSGQSVFVRDAQHRSLLLDASRQIRDEGLKKSIREGIGYHNADLVREDKAIVEDLFSKKQLQVVATTSTLAMGMNLPAFLVIIKGVRVYRGNSRYAMLDYSSILQMIGRAGRPQFDVKGVAVIMAEPKDERSLQNILNLSEVVESSLLHSLAECLNAEICNGMVTDIASAMTWLETTYLYVRIMKNPGYYGIPDHESSKGPDSIIAWLRDSVLGDMISKLTSLGMVSIGADSFSLAAAAPGILMAENYVKLDTMSLIIKLGPKSTMEDFAWVIANSSELNATLIVRRNEKKWLNKINSSSLSKYTIKDPLKPGSKLKRIQLPCQKAFALMMFDLSSECRAMIKKEATRDSGPIQGLIRDAGTVTSKGVQICRCIIRYFEVTKGMASALCEALVFRKVLERRLWPDDPFLITQTKGIGEIIASRLVNNGITTLQKILSTDPRRLEIIAELRPPQGTVMQDNVSHLCPLPLRINTRIQERRTTMVADITVKVAETGEDDAKSSPRLPMTNNSWCRIVVFNSASNTLLVNRRVRYSTFVKDEGICLCVDTRSTPDVDSNVVVRIIDDSVLGVDTRATTPLLPSTEAESKRKTRTNDRNLDGMTIELGNGPSLEKKPPSGNLPCQKAKTSLTPEKKGGPSPTAQQTKLNFAPKKRSRITEQPKGVEAEVIELLDEEEDDERTKPVMVSIPGGAELTQGPKPAMPPTQRPNRITSVSDIASFNSSYRRFMEGFEIFLRDD